MIGPKIKRAVVEAIDGLLEENLSDIDAAHEDAGEIGISISVKLGEVGKNGVNCAVHLGFIKERVKVETKFQIDEKQMEFDFADGVVGVAHERTPMASNSKRAKE